MLNRQMERTLPPRAERLVLLDRRARPADGRWIVVEVNDGQRAGLQGLEPETFYRQLARVLSHGAPSERGR